MITTILNLIVANQDAIMTFIGTVIFGLIKRKVDLNKIKKENEDINHFKGTQC